MLLASVPEITSHGNCLCRVPSTVVTLLTCASITPYFSRRAAKLAWFIHTSEVALHWLPAPVSLSPAQPAKMQQACLREPLGPAPRQSLVRLQTASLPGLCRGSPLGAERTVQRADFCCLDCLRTWCCAGEKPDSRSVGPFTPFAEKWNGRIAMLGFTGKCYCLQLTMHTAQSQYITLHF